MSDQNKSHIVTAVAVIARDDGRILLGLGVDLSNLATDTDKADFRPSVM